MLILSIIFIKKNREGVKKLLVIDMSTKFFLCCVVSEKVSLYHMNVKPLILKLRALRSERVLFHICDTYVGRENEEQIKQLRIVEN